MTNIEYEVNCPVCGNVETVVLHVNDEDIEALDKGEKTLKDCVQPGTFEKELFISGMCYSCQERAFNRPAPGNEDKWGKVVGECDVCGCSIYEKNVNEGKCPFCKHDLSGSFDESDEELKEVCGIKRTVITNAGCSCEMRDATRTLLTALAETGRLAIEKEETRYGQDIYEIATDEELSEALNTYADCGMYSYEEED